MKNDKKEKPTFVVNQSFIDPNTDPKTQLSLAKYEFIYAVIGQILGLVCVLGGIILFFNGIAGSTSWTAKVFGAESTITDAAPGALLFIVGWLFVFVTRYKFVHKKSH